MEHITSLVDMCFQTKQIRLLYMITTKKKTIQYFKGKCVLVNERFIVLHSVRSVKKLVHSVQLQHIIVIALIYTFSDRTVCNLTQLRFLKANVYYLGTR